MNNIKYYIDERLGINGVGEIKAHPFFKGVDWKRIHEKTAPCIPELTSEVDTANFDKFEENEPWITPNQYKIKNHRRVINYYKK
jgi:serine/threonine kinase 38